MDNTGVINGRQFFDYALYGALRSLGMRARIQRRRVWIEGSEAHYFDLARTKGLEQFHTFKASVLDRVAARKARNKERKKVMIADRKTNRADHDTTPRDWFWNTKTLPQCTDAELIEAEDGWTQLLQDCFQDLGISWRIPSDGSEWSRWLRYLEVHAHKLELRAGFLRMVRKEQDLRAAAEFEDWPLT